LVHPLFQKLETKASKADNPDWREVMKLPFVGEYQKAAEKEIETLKKMGV